ncbi:ABC-type multidrug transport system, ATPase component [Sphaerochaeta pleomorpha str. Grapes]|uniref:ABC-type multidrug transport system, ATPase component n=1 Tax=Sphaerochaeta pleomorpha (strain ATCC BAA-1885 / DSM 22778 / Grapes) TaxID=158190 RepID=G8QW48_SPHPG|nr:ABC transporter ATP-binding protein [Sphaerochaeta pleomorpha]AEV28291.1 ABC-type multidrug transport system, ATPase component [Sphaerochaeta pleomorpha str. Grapes]
MDAFHFDSVTKKYPGFEFSIQDLSLPCGTVMGLVGENGAGKTTLVKLLMHMVNPDSGRIEVFGNDDPTTFQTAKQRIGFVLDEANFPDSINCFQVDTIMGYCYHNWDSKVFLAYLERFALPKGKMFKQFSRGMKMKLALAVALSHDAELLVLDEPTGGLDPIVRGEILEIINDYTRDERHSVLISSHIISDLEKICDYVTFLHEGSVLFSQDKETLLDSYALVRCSGECKKELEPSSMLYVRSLPYFEEILMKSELVPSFLKSERVGIEQIMVMMAKGREQKCMHCL